MHSAKKMSIREGLYRISKDNQRIVMTDRIFFNIFARDGNEMNSFDRLYSELVHNSTLLSLKWTWDGQRILSSFIPSAVGPSMNYEYLAQTWQIIGK